MYSTRSLLPMVLLLTLASPVLAALEVFTSVLPLAYLAERVGGERIRVEALVGPGHSPHAYEPSPRQMARLSDSALFVRAGLPYEAGWMPRIQAANPSLHVLDVRDGLPLLPLPANEHDFHGHGNDPDPHVWTDPLLASRIGERIKDMLISIDPQGSAVYTENFDRLSAELAQLDAEIRGRLSGTEHRVFMVFHPAWGYFSAAYGLRQLAIERLGKEPGPRELATVIDEARAEQVRVILVQRQISRKAADAIAQAIGVQVIEVDPLAYDYPAALRQLADVLAGELK